MQNTNPNRIAAIFASARAAQNMNLRKFGEAIGVTYQQVQNYETGKQAPDRERVAAWIESDAPWVRQLGLNIFGAQYAKLIQDVLVPDIKRYKLTPAGEVLADK